MMYPYHPKLKSMNVKKEKNCYNIIQMLICKKKLNYYVIIVIQVFSHVIYFTYILINLQVLQFTSSIFKYNNLKKVSNFNLFRLWYCLICYLKFVVFGLTVNYLMIQ